MNVASWCGPREQAGRTAYRVYRALTTGLSPMITLFLHWRRLRGLEHPVRWLERLGHPSSPRPQNRPLLWFHAVSLGEGLSVIPLIRHCLLQQHLHRSPSGFTILMTTSTASAFEVVDSQLPEGVIHQFAPVDTPQAVGRFIEHWDPSAIFLIESELWPNLILSAVQKGISVALVNARMSMKSFKLWSLPVTLPLISLMLSKLALILSMNTTEAIHFQLLQAPPFIIAFAGDLKYACNLDATDTERKLKDLQLELVDRPVWMASSIHQGEEGVMLWIHKELEKVHPNLVTIIVPRHPQLGRLMAKAMCRAGPSVLLRSKSEKILPTTKIYIVDTLGELKILYSISPVAVIGGSFLPKLAGHNVSEAAARGCAVLTGHFSHMIKEMLRVEPLSVWQVSGKAELLGAIGQLLSDGVALEARRLAAKRAFHSVSGDVVGKVWGLISIHVLNKTYLR